MVSKFRRLAQARPAQPLQVESFMGFPHGLRTSVPTSMVSIAELAECVNFQINRGGQLQSRAGLRRLNSVATGKILTLASAKVGDKILNMYQDEDLKIFRVLDDMTAVELGQTEGKASIVGYGGFAAIADGSYLKYIDDSLTVKLAWDGADPGQFSNLGDTVTGATSYTVAQNVKVPFTTAAWPVGYSIAPTKLRVKLGREGTGGAGPITLTIRKTSDDSIVAYGPVELSAPNIAPDPGDFYNANLTVVHELEPSTAYYVTLTMSAYNSTNYIKWYHGSGGVPICGVYPGLPPKASSCVLHDRRLWLYGDPDGLSRLHFNNYSLFDWSTANYAGYLTALDNSKDSYPIGSVISYFGSLFVYGTEKWPFFLRLTGSDASFVLSDMKQPLWSMPHMTQDVVNDIWALSRGGVSSISGVNMYGDVRTYSESFAIDNLIEEFWTEDSLTGYYIDRGQMLIKVGDRIFAGHTKAPVEGINRARFPWTEFHFNFNATCFGQWGDLVIGSEDGFIYAFDDSLTKDDGSSFYLGLRTKYYQSPFKLIDIIEAKILIDAATGSSFDFRAYKDNLSYDYVHSWSMASALHDDVIINDLGDAIINDFDVIIDPAGSPLVLRLGFTCFAYQVELANIKTVGKPVFIDGFIVRYRPMED